MEHALDTRVIRFGDFDCDTHWHLPGFNRPHQTLLTFLDQADNTPNVFEREAGFLGDLSVAVPASLHAVDVVEQIERPVATPGAVLDQAHDQAVFAVRVDDESRYRGLFQDLERLNPPLATHQVVAGPLRMLATGHGNRLLEADRADAINDLPEYALAARPGVNDVDHFDRDHLDPRFRFRHATSGRLTLEAMP